MHATTAKLLNWINTHDCGITPTAVYDPEQEAIVIRIEEVCAASDSYRVYEEIVHTYEEARAVLGY